MMRTLGFLALFSLATVLACGDDPVLDGDDDTGDDAPSDGGGGGKKDAGSKDAGSKDAGKDAAAPPKDAGPKDAGPQDATAPEQDAAEPADASSSDASDDDAGNVQDASTGTDAGGGTDGGLGVVGAVYLNEVHSDPPGDDANNEFVELGCTPGLALDPYWFVVADGDRADGTPTAPGKVTVKKKLTGLTCGTGGLVVLQKGNVYDGVAGTTFAKSFFGDTLENGSQTYLLLQTAAFDVADVDVDANDDGVLDEAVQALVVDSVALRDGNVGDKAYSPAVLEGNDHTAALSRFAGAATIEAASWYFGATTGPSPWHYAVADVSPNFPAGGTLSPGSENTPKP